MKCIYSICMSIYTFQGLDYTFEATEIYGSIRSPRCKVSSTSGRCFSSRLFNIGFSTSQAYDLSTSWSCSQPLPSSESSLVVSLLRRSGLAVVVDEIRREDRSSNINGEVLSFCIFGLLVSCLFYNIPQTFHLIKLLYKFIVVHVYM